RLRPKPPLEPGRPRHREQRGKEIGTNARADQEVLEDCQSGPESEALERAGNSQPRQLVGRGAEQRLAAVADRAPRRPKKAAHGIEAGGVAGAGGCGEAVGRVSAAFVSYVCTLV